MRLMLAFVAVAAAVAFTAASATATIHPLTVGWVCGNASGDPPGQTPGATPHSDQSTLRALQATGILTFGPSGPSLNLNDPASKFSAFQPPPAVETGIPSNEGAINCANADLPPIGG
jgi:hypothetical protein